jgi:RNA polymerase sigma factor for flagellar operon FliA
MWQRLAGQMELDELVSLGLGVLLDAVRRYDPERAELSPYLTRRLKWSMLAEARKRARRLVDPSQSSGVFAESASVDRTCHVPFEDRIGRVGALLPAGDMASVALCREEDPELVALRREAGKVLRSAIAALPDRQRHLLERHYFDGLPFERVAAEIGVTRAAVSRMHRSAVAALARELRRMGYDGAPLLPAPRRRARRSRV